MNMQMDPFPDQKADSLVERPRHGGIRVLMGAVGLVLVLGGFWYWNHEGDSADPHRVLAAPVHVAAVSKATMPVVERTIGTVIANSTVLINTRVQGQLVKAYFKEGQMVRQGDLLFQIDPRPYQAAYDNARASLASAKAKAERYKRLLGQNAISPQDADDAEAAYLEAKATTESALLNLEFTQIHAPVSGKTGPILIQPGNMVAASTASTNATPLVQINEIQPVKVSFSLPQSDLPRIQARQKGKGLMATISMEGAGGKTISAPVDFVSNAVTGSTGTIELRATFPNHDLALVPGQLVDVTVELDSIPNALIVPHDAVNQGPNGPYVYAVQDERAMLKPVNVLFDDTTNVAVEGKLAVGEQVVTDGQLRVVPGAKVFVEGARRGENDTGGADQQGRKRRTS
ncbi:MAG TPA: efflux RND transporter periplasmic adaptor subunit [Rhizomicrobium sp.]|jgi:multidrug efflux system membrane fusion protein|nr:efflux RND transporter periplasmic adaptor subunit [Rhizomicrobium sp.]